VKLQLEVWAREVYNPLELKKKKLVYYEILHSASNMGSLVNTTNSIWIPLTAGDFLIG
jgi:hypothetical protein